ncbi:MAG TPA: RiPP maturation radical SAM C-methyltransferase [Pseudolabrys sp.]|nr:RiPP maturation radical SAM C-methyltransferase [Pseudolabrys sp.]
MNSHDGQIENPDESRPLTQDSGLDVCLVVPPFGPIAFPAMGPAVLAAACRSKGLDVRVLYGDLLLAARIGHAKFESICEGPAFHAMTGDRLFVPHAYPAEALSDINAPQQPPSDLDALYDDVAAEIDSFLDEFTARILATRPRIVGISTCFQQNLAASAIARRIRKVAPNTCIVFGGANVAGQMADGLAQVFPWVDYFFSGEADVEFPAFCRRYVEEHTAPSQKVIRCAPVANMDDVHAPDFSDYFLALREQQDRGRLPQDLPTALTMETSRGCWWGEKHHCTFCGLNPNGMEFRRKPADRVLGEIKELTSAWNADRLNLADNILPMSYFDDLLPALARFEERPKLFYEAKANLKYEQLQLMARAGIDRIQPGIESFSTHVLRLMRKGVTGAQNLALLRSCRSLNIKVLWNYLYGFPGETAEDYEAVLPLLPALEHLEPPKGLFTLSIDRFSPYFNTPEQFGITNTRPTKQYRAVYPHTAPISDIAFHFTGRISTPMIDDDAKREEFRDAIETWRRQWTADKRPILTAVDRGDGTVAITDTRRIAKARTTAISRAMDMALRHCERPRGTDQLDGFSREDIDFLIDRRFLLQHEGLFLTVVTRISAVLARSRSRPAVEHALGT